MAGFRSWLGSARRNHGQARRRGERAGVAAAAQLARFRAAIGLGQPYGPKAVELGLGPADPPSRRPRGAPPG